MSNWQDISTAPKDGSPILVGYFGDGDAWSDRGDMTGARWRGDRWSTDANEDRLIWKPTHWMPRPAAPE